MCALVGGIIDNEKERLDHLVKSEARIMQAVVQLTLQYSKRSFM